MSLIISGYSRDAFKEYLLSSLNNADYSHYQVRKTGSPTSPPTGETAADYEKWKFAKCLPVSGQRTGRQDSWLPIRRGQVMFS